MTVPTRAYLRQRPRVRATKATDAANTEIWRKLVTIAREIMHNGATCIGEHDTLTTAARHMRDLDVGALPICGDDGRLYGIITDRDIVVRCIANGQDPSATTAIELAQGHIHYIDAAAPAEEVLSLMEEYRIRRLPVLDDHQLVGMISEADLARHLPEPTVGEFVESICAAGELSGK